MGIYRCRFRVNMAVATVILTECRALLRMDQGV